MAETTSNKDKEKERRKFKRVDVRLLATYKLTGEADENTIYSLDISAGGARVWLNRIIKKGTLITFKACLNEGKETVSCKGSIAWQNLRPVKADDGKYYYQTGVQFEDLELKDRMRLIYYCHNFGKHVPSKIK
ncbi:MAG: PilZ domain-containing protein [Deltaproteobacteria bacterium]